MKKKILAMLILMLSLTFSAVLPVLAYSNDDINYSFTIGANKTNGYSGVRHRSTTNTRNAWKVNMTYDSEGSNTQATYWLARNSGKAIASDVHTIKASSGAHYYSATSVASDKDVVLAAENNNVKPKGYTVKGYWDEETGVYV